MHATSAHAAAPAAHAAAGDQAIHVGRGLRSGARAAERPRSVAVFVREVHLAAAPEDVFEWCLRADSVQAMLPERAEPDPGTPEVAVPGGTYSFRHWLNNLVPIRWVVHVERFEAGREFVDLQLRGAFRYFRHTHTCLPAPGGGTLYRDTLEYRTMLGALFDRVVTRRQLEQTFAHRHRVMQERLGR